MSPETERAFVALHRAMMDDDSFAKTVIVAKIGRSVLQVDFDSDCWKLASAADAIKRYFTPAVMCIKAKIADAKSAEARI